MNTGNLLEGKGWSELKADNVAAMKKKKLIYDRQSVGQSVLVSGAHLGPVTNFSFALKFPVDSCGFVIL
jgi:hypothetical protein